MHQVTSVDSPNSIRGPNPDAALIAATVHPPQFQYGRLELPTCGWATFLVSQYAVILHTCGMSPRGASGGACLPGCDAVAAGAFALVGCDG